ncbi:ADP-ribosylglycohydrolase family protein [Streptomyces longispororuber]|uniref:ADP-ribosylglycohydrolase family protein n=1 Tax=Streptomyces longispororuber TaxID=68230 RepID=UPI0036F6C0B1
MASVACVPPAPAPDGAGGPRERARGAMLGLAVGDALGAPAENLKPSEIRRRWGRITGYVVEHPAGTDDTEYAIFSGLLLARHGSALTVSHVEAAWHEWIADLDEGPFRGAGFSERGTLENLRRGLAAPISAQHRHAWSDGLAMRAAPFGVFAAGHPAEAARLVAVDGTVSHDGEGIYGGQAVAAGVAAAMAGAPVATVVAAALAVVPYDSWTSRSLRRAVAAAHRGERAVRSAVVVGGYPWTDLAPEAVGLAFGAYAAAAGDFATAVLMAVNMGRDADTTAAVAGALAGATCGATAIPPEWTRPLGPARGTCLPTMRGHHVLDIADLLTPDGEGAQVPVPSAAHRPAAALLAVGRRPAGRTGPPLVRSRELGEGWAQPEVPSNGAPGPIPASAPGRSPVRLDRAQVEGLLLGLAAGDAAGWPAARHRAARMPDWTRRLTRELDTFAEHNATTTLPVPIALNQPPEPLRLGPSDDAEWAAFTAESVLTAADGTLDPALGRDRRTRAALAVSWHTLAGEIAAAAARAPEVESAVLPLRARISVRAGLGNLAAGLAPPATGHDNPHYFDDAACVRACVLALVHPGDPERAAALAEFDARYTQDGDGVHGARAMAAAVAAALGGAGPDDAVDTALGQLPEHTEIGRNARHAVKLARACAPAPDATFALVPLLEHEIVDHVYSYGIAAAETVPVALALAAAARGRVREAVPAAACLSRVADSAPALAGALTGVLGTAAALPDTWRASCRTLSGCALPRLAGTDLVELAAHLTRTT